MQNYPYPTVFVGMQMISVQGKKKQIFKKNRLHLVVYFTFLAAFGVFFLHHMSVCCSSRETAINHEIMSQKGVHDGWAVATRGDFSLRLEAG